MTTTPGIGHNSRAYFADRLNDFATGADVWNKRNTLDRDTAPRARDFLAGLKKLSKEADEARKAEKDPHTAAAKAVDEAWKPTMASIDRLIAGIEPKITEWLREEKRKADAAKAIAERARMEAEAAARAAAEDAARAQTEAGRIAADAARAEAERRAARAAREERAAGGPVRLESATGLARAAGVRVTRRARIVSVAMALAHYRARPEVAELVERLANADIRAAKGVSIEIPGVEIVTEESLSA